MMSEWHLSPDYIVRNWTDELLNLMCEKLMERKQREVDSLNATQSSPDRSVPIETLAAMSHGMIKVEKKANGD